MVKLHLHAAVCIVFTSSEEWNVHCALCSTILWGRAEDDKRVHIFPSQSHNAYHAYLSVTEPSLLIASFK